jgi:hypothetical protein
LNVHEPTQPGGCGSAGSGGTGPLLSPPVCTHDVGRGPSVPKSMLWKLLPVGYENVTLAPAVMVTDGSPVVGFAYPMS